ncbi:MAG: acyltransferase [Streptosporangiales bacterium]|nr:acyltransferase [Streptosporangiales bacterium]
MGAMRRVLARLVHQSWVWLAATGEVTPDTPAGMRFGRLGTGSCLVFPTGSVFGEEWIHIGERTVVGPYVSLSAGMVPGLDLGSEPIVRIGDRCKIGRGSHIVRHHSIEIGDDVITGPYVYVTDQNHGYADPDVPIDRQWPTEDPVRIGSGTWLAAGAIVLPGTRLGRNVVVAAGSVVRGEFPDRCVVAGVPARIVRRYEPGSGWQPPLRPSGADRLPPEDHTALMSP